MDGNARKPQSRVNREGSLADFFARSPLRGLKIERFKETEKPIDLGDAPAPLLNPWRKSRR